MLMGGRHWAKAAAAALALLLLLGFQRDVVGLVPYVYQDLVRLGVVVVGALFGVLAVRGATATAARVVNHRVSSHWHHVVTWALYVILALWLASSLGVNLSGLLVGGALAGVVVGTASQGTIGNIFAGLVLTLTRPYAVGTRVRVHNSALGSNDYEGTVEDIGALYTTLHNDDGVVRLPNAAVAAAALMIPGRAAPTATSRASAGEER